LDPEAGLHQPCGSQDGGAKPGKASDSRVIQAAAFVRARAWTPESRAYAVLNDLDRGAPLTVTDALQSYKMRPIPRSKMSAVKELPGNSRARDADPGCGRVGWREFEAPASEPLRIT